MKSVEERSDENSKIFRNDTPSMKNRSDSSTFPPSSRIKNQDYSILNKSANTPAPIIKPINNRKLRDSKKIGSFTSATTLEINSSEIDSQDFSQATTPLITIDMEPSYPTNRVKTSFYTKYNFLFLNLYVQFSKITNLFFLTVLVLLLIPSISPTTGYTYIFALLMVVVASMLKDAFEDLKRHRDDRKTNERAIKSLKIENGEFTELVKTAEFVHKGEFILLEKGEEVPAEGVMILSFSSLINKKINNKKYKNLIKIKRKQRCQGYSYIETSKIDGESCWKKKYSKISNEDCSCLEYKYIKESDLQKYRLPDCLKRMLLKIKELDFRSGSSPVIHLKGFERRNHKENILLKGTIVKSEYVVLLIHKLESQIMNIEEMGIMKLTKTSTFTSKMYEYLRVVFYIFIVFLIISICFLPSQLKSPYLFIKNKEVFWETVRYSLTNYISLAYVIPLSLCVMLEVARIFYKLYAQNLIALNSSNDIDRHISNVSGWRDLMNMNNKDGNKITIRNTEVIEQLGSTETIVTDKTGTLTLNEMVFRFFYVHYTDIKDSDSSTINNIDSSTTKSTVDYNRIEKVEIPHSRIAETHQLTEWGHSTDHVLYILLLICCNSVYVFDSEMSGTSTDEVAILNKITAITYNNNQNNINNRVVWVHEKDDNFVHCSLFGNEVYIKIIRTLGFCSKNRKMSVVIEIQNIVEKDNNSEKKRNGTSKVLNNLVGKYILLTKGSRDSVNCPHLKTPLKYIHLRELVLGYKYLDSQIISRITDPVEFESVYNSPHSFLGITLVDDTLQPDLLKTLSIFQNVFIVTGDKRGTALGVAKSMNMKVEWSKEFSEIKEVDLVLESDALKYPQRYYVKESLRTEEDMYNNNKEVRCRILYNILPEQKKEIVKRIQQQGPCLAIGDGFNDVPMVSESSIGVGIEGMEGCAASNCADVSVTSFNCLIPLVYISRQAYLGFSLLVFNSIMKNIFLIGIQLLLFFKTNGSIYNGSFLAWFNVLFTSMITFSEACGGRGLFFDVQGRKELLNKSGINENRFQDITQDPSLRPLYSHMKCHNYFSRKKFIFLSITSIIKSILVYFVTYVMFDKFKYIDLQTVELILSYIVFLCIVLRQIGILSNINGWVCFWTVFSFGMFFSFVRGFRVLRYSIEIMSVCTVALVFDILRDIFVERVIL